MNNEKLVKCFIYISFVIGFVGGGICGAIIMKHFGC